jgi:hypothetical protein
MTASRRATGGLCTLVAASIAKELAIPNLQTSWVKVSVANR